MKHILIGMVVMVTVVWGQEAFVYRDRVVIEKALDQVVSLMIPAEAFDVESYPLVTVAYERVTNIYPEDVMLQVKEYVALTNEITQKRRKLQQQEQRLTSQNERVKLFGDLLKGLANNQGAKTAELMEKYERQLSSTEEGIRQLREEIEVVRQEVLQLEGKAQEMQRFLSRKVIPMRVWEFAKPYRGVVRYSLRGQWRMRYTLSTERETLKAEVEVNASSPFQEQVSSLWILGFPYTSQHMEQRLPRLRLYTQRMYVRSPMAKSAAPLRVQEESLSPETDEVALPPVESTEGQGTVWQITNRVSLSQQTVVTLWEARRVSFTTSYFVLAPKSSWGWYALTLSNTLPYTLIPGEVVLESRGKTQRMMLSRAVVPHGSYQFAGIEVRDIEVRRELVKDYKDTPNVFRPTLLHEKLWKITVKNRLNKTIPLVIWERIPLSAEDRIFVKNVIATDKTAAELKTIQTNDGIVKWEIMLPPGEEKVLSFGYTIEYPKDTEYYEQEE
ncbi:MAG: DUF4139 domain-containing protein [Brevinematales bacterium]|nr:DUF4139 domain-containing protein [Brevinematales bacterium]